MTRFDGVIFDFNGVLWWDTPLIEQAWITYSAQVRATPLTHEEMQQHTHGRPNGDIMRYLKGDDLDAATVAAMTQAEETIYRGLCLQQGENFKLSPGAIELLDYLVAQDIPHTIATSSEGVNVRFFIQHLGLERWFDVDKIVFDNGTFPGKPAPDIFQIAAQRLGLPPERCLVCEDSLAGLAAAHAAGIGKIVALSTGSTPEVLRQQPGVSTVIPDFYAFDRDWLAAN